jgi:pseudaminic acid synthase
MTFAIEGVDVGGRTSPCRFAAEISNSHGGSLDRALRMVRAAKDAGCEFVKFQAFTPQELVDLRGDGPAPEPWGSQGWGVRDLYEKARTPLVWFPMLFAYAREIGIVPFASFFGRESFAALRAVDAGAYKLASLDREHTWLRELALSSGKPVIVSAPDRADCWSFSVHPLKCPPGYPQAALGLDWYDFNPDYESPRGEGHFIGLSYHGSDYRPCLAAATLGAKLIEFHFMLADEPSELESAVSLTQYQAALLIEHVRVMERCIA